MRQVSAPLGALYICWFSSVRVNAAITANHNIFVLETETVSESVY